MRTRHLFFAAAAVLLASCAENRSSFYIQDNKAPTDDCTIPSDKGAAFIGKGIWDLGLTATYHVHPLVVNQMSSSVKLNPVSAETSIVLVEGAWVTLESVDEVEYTKIFVASTASVEPEGGTTSMDFEAMNEFYLSQFLPGLSGGTVNSVDDLRAEPKTVDIILKIQIVGKTTGGSSIKTPSYLFPLKLCAGCLVYFTPEAWDEEAATFNCHSTTSAVGSPCMLGQDKDVDCRTCGGNNPSMCDPSMPTFSNPWF